MPLLNGNFNSSEYQSIDTYTTMEMEIEANSTKGERLCASFNMKRFIASALLFSIVIPTLFYISSRKSNSLSSVSYEQTSEMKYAEDDSTAKSLFDEFILKYDRSYNSVEYSLRFKIFKNNLKMIDVNNKAERDAGGSAIHGITQFADLSMEEFQGKYLNAKIDDDFQRSANDYLQRVVQPYVGSSTFNNWAGIYTTPIKNQRNCGACWAFAAAEQVESDAIRLVGWNKSIALSTQQLVDCDTANLACSGGSPYNAYAYIKTNGLELNKDYPYTSGTTKVAGTCMYSSYIPYVSISGYTFLNNGDSSAYASTEIAMANYVLSTGTLSVMVAATSWLSYSSGILTVCTGSINHVVQITGVDLTNNYWIIRNSWGLGFGYTGYIYVQYGSNLCYLAAYPSYVTSYLKVTSIPTRMPTRGAAVIAPTAPPTRVPTKLPSRVPSIASSGRPTTLPTRVPTKLPSKIPNIASSGSPTTLPTRVPTKLPSKIPNIASSGRPTTLPTRVPSKTPTRSPSRIPAVPTTATAPTNMPSKSPSRTPVKIPTKIPSKVPSKSPI